ncbi:MAG: hypothetical protein Q8909_03505 [Bacteroidota bacterium]|nr:hypothetical protein [Bacteroidota bacterium]
MGFISNIFSGGTGSVVDAIGDTIDKLTTTKEEKMQLELEMKKADMQYQLEMQRLSLKEKQQDFMDIDSARKRSAAVETSDHATLLSRNTSSYLALCVTALTFSLFYIILFHSVTLDDNGKDIVLYILGVLSAILTQIFSFYFGSSQGSVVKDEIIHGMSQRKTTDVTDNG